jgi:pimeloyl-ACP methyl ester carboxylesterase
LLRPATFLANARDVADLSSNLEPQVARYPELTMLQVSMPQVAVPIVVVSGNMDFVVAPQPHAVAFAAAVPRARLVMLPGIGHMLHHAAADRVVAEIEGLATMIVSPQT